MVIQAFRLKKDLMSLTLAEPDDFILDRGAVARANAFDLPGIHRRAMQICSNDRVGCNRGAGNVAWTLWCGDTGGQIGKWNGRIIPGLSLQTRPINRSPVKTRWGSGFQPPQGKTHALKRRRQPQGW